MAQLMQVSLARHAGNGGHVARDGQSRNRTDGLGGMRGSRVVAALLAAALATVALAACDDSPTQNPTSSPTISEPTTTSPTPTETATPSPTPTSDEEVAAANAERTLRDFYRVTDELSSDSARSLDELKSVATSVALDSWTQEFTSTREQGLKQTGATEVVEIELVDVSLDNTDPAHGRVPSVRFNVCYDVSDVVITDAAGAAVDNPDRAPRGWEQLTVGNYTWDDDPETGWRVSSGETLEREPCDAK